MDLIINTQSNIVAGFTLPPDVSDVIRDGLVEHAKEKGGCVVRPCLVHGKYIKNIEASDVDSKSYLQIEDCDGLVSNLSNVVLTSTHGDCLPIYAWDDTKGVIGLAHAGWKGTKLGIAKELICKMVSEYQCDPCNIHAFIGPGIDKCCFEVTKEVYDEFDKEISWFEHYVTPKDELHYLIDLKGINYKFIQDSGVKHIEISPDCTCCNSKYYSYRRNKESKRMLAYIYQESFL